MRMWPIQCDGQTCSCLLLGLLLHRSCIDPFLAPSIGSSTSFKGHWIVSRLQVTRKTMRTSRLCLSSWIVFEMLPSIVRSVVISGHPHGLLTQATVQTAHQQAIYDQNLKLIVSS